jgi:hypothetical protein
MDLHVFVQNVHMALLPRRPTQISSLPKLIQCAYVQQYHDIALHVILKFSFYLHYSKMCLFQLCGIHGWRKQRRFQTLVMMSFLTWSVWSQAMCLALFSCCQAQRSKPARYCRLASIQYNCCVCEPLPHKSHNTTYYPANMCEGPAMHNCIPSVPMGPLVPVKYLPFMKHQQRKQI